MTHGTWHMTDGRRISKLLPFAICHLPSATCHLTSVICHLSFAICHLPSAICHLPFAMPAPRKMMLVRRSPAAQPRRLARHRFRDRDFPPETHAAPRAAEREAAGGAWIERVRACETVRIVSSARARRQQARPPRRECGRRHGEPSVRARKYGPAPTSLLPSHAGSMAREIPRNPAALQPGRHPFRSWARNALPPSAPCPGVGRGLPLRSIHGLPRGREPVPPRVKRKASWAEAGPRPGRARRRFRPSARSQPAAPGSTARCGTAATRLPAVAIAAATRRSRAPDAFHPQPRRGLQAG